MPKFATGVIRFQNEVYPDKKELFEKLSKGQSRKRYSSLVRTPESKLP